VITALLFSRVCYVENSAAMLSTLWHSCLCEVENCHSILRSIFRWDLPFHKPRRVFRSPINIEVFFLLQSAGQFGDTRLSRKWMLKFWYKAC